MKQQINDFVDRSRKPRKPTFTDRDWRILEHIWEFDGVLADYQIKQLEFADNADLQQTKNRLSLLFHTGYVARLNRAGWTRYGCNVYWLTKRSRDRVAGLKGEDLTSFPWRKEPNWSQLEHDLLVTDFTLVLFDACTIHPEVTLYDWLPESYFRKGPETREVYAGGCWRAGQAKPYSRQLFSPHSPPPITREGFSLAFTP